MSYSKAITLIASEILAVGWVRTVSLLGGCHREIPACQHDEGIRTEEWVV